MDEFVERLSYHVSRDASSRLFYPLAQAYRVKGRTDEAIETLHNGLEANPDYDVARTSLIAVLHDAGRDQDAALAATDYAEWLEEQERFADAEEQYEKALHLAPNGEELYERLQALRQRVRSVEETDELVGESEEPETESPAEEEPAVAEAVTHAEGETVRLQTEESPAFDEVDLQTEDAGVVEADPPGDEPQVDSEASEPELQDAPAVAPTEKIEVEQGFYPSSGSIEEAFDELEEEQETASIDTTPLERPDEEQDQASFLDDLDEIEPVVEEQPDDRSLMAEDREPQGVPDSADEDEVELEFADSGDRDEPQVSPDTEIPVEPEIGASDLEALATGPADVEAEDERPVSEAPAAAVEAPAEDDEPIPTRTLAELYEKQGHIDEAIEVYQQLLQENPGDVEVAERLAALTSAEPEEEDLVEQDEVSVFSELEMESDEDSLEESAPREEPEVEAVAETSDDQAEPVSHTIEDQDQVWPGLEEAFQHESAADLSKLDQKVVGGLEMFLNGIANLKHKRNLPPLVSSDEE